MKIKENIGIFIFTAVIGGVLIIGSLMNIGLVQKPIERLGDSTIDFSQFVDEIKSAYVSDFSNKECFINLNGLFARITGRHVYNEVSVLENGMLDYETLKELDMTAFANSVIQFDAFLKENGIAFLYAQVPNKSDLQDTLVREGIDNYGNRNANELIGLLEKTDTEILDLRQSISATPELVEKYFYNTDHHWNTHGAFVAFGELLQYLNEMFPAENIDLSLADASNWSTEVYEDWFLGSRGKRVGIYFGGVDDLTIYMPNFETDMSFYVPKHREYYSGSFADAVIREKFLDAPDYFNENPYCAYIGGDYPLVHHRNELVENDLKVLIIKDSFSLPLQSFLSTAVKELDVLDPRYYTESTISEYVAVSQPDIVIMLINPSVLESSAYYHFGIPKEEEGIHKTERTEISYFAK
ncbi:MAG: hypothetical protein IJX80_08780 [Clostridia bacterium]|nr:hypothetical protein [Clostridia bacterium]